MSDTKTFVFGNEGASGNLLASILPSLQQRGIDTGYLMGMLGNNNNGGLFGGRGFEDIIALIIVAAIFGNGNFGFGNNGNSTNGELLASMVQRNGVDLSQLAQTLGVSGDRIHDAIGQVSTQISTLAGQQGMSFQQVINSILTSQTAITSQLASCCCDIKGAIADSKYAAERGFCDLTAATTRGFSDIGYAFRDQTCNLEKAGSANTAAIIAKLDAIEDSRKDRELAEKDRMIATLTARSERQAELQPIYSALQEIQCNQPPVKKISCPEQYVPLNTSVNATYGLIPTHCGYGFGGYGFGSGWNGWNGGSLWG